MITKYVTFLFVFFLLSSQAYSVSASENFKYRFYGSDIFTWVKGEKQGKVTESQGKMAKALAKELKLADEELNLAIYGVASQNWFLNILGDSKAKVNAVVDQTTGKLGEWKTENFMYPDTYLMPQYIGEENVIPDMNQDQKPRAGSIMHNKFVVIDHKKVWLGSTNISHTGIGSEYNANTSILIESKQIAKFYNDEFSKMFTEKDFSYYKSKSSKDKIVKYKDGTIVSVYFSPQDNATQSAVIPFIKNAKKTLKVGIFYLTDRLVAEALVEAKNRGVKVKLIYDALAGSHPSSQLDFLNSKKVEVRVENWGGKMHMKTAVSDGINVIMGSMNWTEAGNYKNDENIIVIKNNKNLASDVESYFDRLWGSLEKAKRISKSNRVYVPRAEGTKSINSCFDGLDNDHDGNIDSADSSCQVSN